MLISNITASHKEYIQKLINGCNENFIVVSPYLTSNPKMSSFLDKFDFSGLKRIDLVTTFKPKDAEQLTKPFEIRDFISHFEVKYPSIEVFVHIDNSLHGKLYISKASHKKMIITSANFTHRGMSENHEWGILIDDPITIEKALEEIFESIEYPEVSMGQIKKACFFAEGNIKENPKWTQKTTITCNILDSVYSDNDARNINPQYFLKPIGHTESPITLDSQRDFSKLHQDLHFSKKMPKGIKKGDIIITTAVGAGSLLSYFRVTGNLQQITNEQIRITPWLKRWPWYLEGRNNSPQFGKYWWIHNLRRQDLLEEFKSLYPKIPVTYAGGFTLGTINMGNDKVKITKEFGEFLIEKITEAEKNLRTKKGKTV